MNENIDLTKILKDCPKGTKLYSPIFGEVEFEGIVDNRLNMPIKVTNKCSVSVYFSIDGKCNSCILTEECMLFPFKENRDWSQWECPKPKFDPKTLNEFDRVLGRDCDTRIWKCNLFSHINEQDSFSYKCVGNAYRYCIPYNDDTKHLVGTTAKAPEYYRYWED